VVEAIAVQSGAVNRTVGDSFATDRTSSPNPGGLLFDLMALSSTVAVAAAGKALPPRADSPVSAPAHLSPPIENAIPVSASDLSEVSHPAPVDAIPVSVEALIAMDKAAKQGLESKSFVPKPETEWSISILPSVTTATIDPSRLAFSRPSLNPDIAPPTPTVMGNENHPKINLASASETGSPAGNAGALQAISPTVTAVLPEAEIAPVEPVPSVSSAIVLPMIPDPVTTVNVDHPEVTVIATPSLESATPDVNLLTNATNLNGPVTVTSEPVTPTVSQSLFGVIGDKADTLLGTISNTKSKPQIASDLGANVPSNAPLITEALAPNGRPAKPVSEPTASTQTPALELQAQTPMPLATENALLPLTGKSVNSATPIPVISNTDALVVSREPLDAATGTLSQAAPKGGSVAGKPTQFAGDTKLTPKAPLSPRSSPARKDTNAKSGHPKTDPTPSTRVGVDAANPSILAAFAPMVSPSIAASPSSSVVTSADTTSNEETIAVSVEDNRKPTAPRGNANAPVFSLPNAPMPATQTQAAGPANTGSGQQESGVTPDHSRDENTVALETDYNSHPDQGQGDHPEQQDTGTANGLVERISDRTGSTTGRAVHSQNSVTTIENLPPIAGINTDTLPANVTVESISIRSDRKSEETVRPSVQGETSSTLSPLPVLHSADTSGGVVVDPSSFQSHASTPTTGTAPASGASAQANVIRTDNPNFIAQRDRAMEQQIIAAIRAGHNEIRLSLYPAQLGQVTINMALDGQKVRVGMKTTNREATNILLGDRQSLAMSLGNEGFTLDSFDVSDDQPHQQAPNDQTARPSQAAVTQSTDSSFSLDITI